MQQEANWGSNGTWGKPFINVHLVNNFLHLLLITFNPKFCHELLQLIHCNVPIPVGVKGSKSVLQLLKEAHFG